MDPVSLVVGALAAGAAGGVTETVSAAVKDAYDGLKELLRRRLQGSASGETALREHEQDPETWRAPLAKALRESGAVEDQAVIAAAQQVLALVDAPGTRSGKYVVDVRHSQGTVIGDHTQVVQSFTTPPPQ